MIFVQTSQSKEDPLRSQMKDFCGFHFQPTGLMNIKAVGDAGYPTIHDKIKKHLHSSAKSLFAFDRTFAPLILTTISKNQEQAFMMKCEVEGRLNPEGNTRKNHTTRETFAVIIYLVGLIWIWRSGVLKPWTRGPSTKFEPIHSFDQCRWDKVLHILPPLAFVEP